MKQRIGVYICHCGGNISDYVDVAMVQQAVEKEQGVVLAKTTMFACADSNQKQMITDIKENQLDAVVVAACSPKLHLITFQSVVERIKLNKFNYIHANIREQVSWAHSDDKTGATEKAIKIVRAAIARVRLSEAIEPIEVKTEQAVLVIGAGVAGMKASVALAKLGINVHLIDREHFVGGHIAQWDILWTTDETGKDLVTRLYNDVKATGKISLFTGAELVESTGNIGNFNVKIKITPRYIREPCDPGYLTRAIEICPVEVPDAFNFNITKRKAIYHNFPSEYPHAAVIDMEHCTRCGECEKICNQVDFSRKTEYINLKVGSILVATGYDPYIPHEGEFGFRAIDNVITLPQFKRLTAISEKKLEWKGKPVNNIAYIYCVGSRQTEGENKYCSRYCCTAAIYSAIMADNKFRGLSHFHFTRGIRTYGKQELLYHQASREGQIFLQSYEDDPPRIEKKKDKTLVYINDILTCRKTVEVEADLVVLVTGMIPRSNNTVGDILKIPRGRDKFFNEIHMKLRPVETVINGITIAGCSQGPKNLTESINSALSAAIKSYSIVSTDVLKVEPIIAEVNPGLCEWCDACSKACPYGAIQQVQVNGRTVAKVLNAACNGCGMCLPVCPTNAIQLKTYSDKEIMDMIDALAEKE